MTTDFDVLVVGGGINGTGIARDAAGRGLKVCLAEQGDLASGTSSASSKMIHGGLRYLEYYEFALVRQALKEREKLLRIAPHLISPLRIVLPILPNMRPAWLIRLGLWIYDHLGGKISLPATRALSLKDTPEGAPLTAGLNKAFAYFDGWVDDARLVVLNAVDAAAQGANIRTRTRLTKLEANSNNTWSAELSTASGIFTCTAKCVINAAGPWANQVDSLAGLSHAKHLVKVQGSHIVLPKLYAGEHAYLLQNPDGRVLFAIPYQNKFTLFGTTDTPMTDDPAAAALTPDETNYLLNAVSRFFEANPTKRDIIWSYSGVRALFGDPQKSASALSRDYKLVMDDFGKTPPFLSILGGKVTTYRSLSEKAVDKVANRLGNTAKPWTSNTPLPGGNLGDGGIDALIEHISQQWGFLPPETAQRLARAYGTLVFDIYSDVTKAPDLGINFGHGFTEKEARYLRDHEFAMTADDILWRRSKIGLHLNPLQITTFETWFRDNLAGKNAIPPNHSNSS